MFQNFASGLLCLRADAIERISYSNRAGNYSARWSKNASLMMAYQNSGQFLSSQNGRKSIPFTVSQGVVVIGHPQRWHEDVAAKNDEIAQRLAKRDPFKTGEKKFKQRPSLGL